MLASCPHIPILWSTDSLNSDIAVLLGLANKTQIAFSGNQIHAVGAKVQRTDTTSHLLKELWLAPLSKKKVSS